MLASDSLKNQPLLKLYNEESSIDSKITTEIKDNYVPSGITILPDVLNRKNYYYSIDKNLLTLSFKIPDGTFQKNFFNKCRWYYKT